MSHTSNPKTYFKNIYLEVLLKIEKVKLNQIKPIIYNEKKNFFLELNEIFQEPPFTRIPTNLLPNSREKMSCFLQLQQYCKVQAINDQIFHAFQELLSCYPISILSHQE
jgi:hypothetical protein